jgi:uncharacterized membrane protein
MVAGVLVWLPILATIWVVSFMLHIMDRTLLLLPPSYRPQALVGFALPGAGLALALVIVLLTGLLVTNLIGRRFVIWGEDLLNRIPVVRSIYGGVKSFTESVLSQSKSFRQVVMVEYPGEPYVAVYISAALNATAGYLVIVPRRQVVNLDMSVDAAMKMIISCGVVVPPAHADAAHPHVAKPAA